MSRAFACNRDFLRQLRLRNGWTQADLARRAGYSERLISKAEAGAPIARETISDLAEALSSEDEQLHWEDLACDPVQLAQRYISAFHVHKANALDVLEDMIDENVHFRIAGNPEEIPFAGEYRGIRSAREMFKVFFSVLEVPDHDFEKCFEYIGQGPNAIIWGESWIHPIGRPMETPIRISNLLKFRRGKLVFLDDCFDTAAGAAELNNRPKS